MPTEQAITEAIEAYAAAVSGDDVESILKLFADNAVVEDPVGSEPHVGRDALRQFYQMAVDSVEKMVTEGRVRAREKWGACAMLAYPAGTDGKMVIETLDVMEFDEAGKITRMTAYWGDGNLREVK